jgi:hypothetical protein
MNATHDQKKKTPEHTSASSVQTADESNES